MPQTSLMSATKLFSGGIIIQSHIHQNAGSLTFNLFCQYFCSGWSCRHGADPRAAKSHFHYFTGNAVHIDQVADHKWLFPWKWRWNRTYSAGFPAANVIYSGDACNRQLLNKHSHRILPREYSTRRCVQTRIANQIFRNTTSWSSHGSSVFVRGVSAPALKKSPRRNEPRHSGSITTDISAGIISFAHTFCHLIGSAERIVKWP